MNRLLIILSFLISFIFLASYSWALPPCPSSGYFHNCYGSNTFSSGSVYVGEYQNNKRNGQGTFIFGPNSEWAGDKYIGEYKDNKKHGLGKYFYLEGDKYEGEFKEGYYHGQGIYTYPDGEKYEGEYKNNKRNGQGKYTYANGKVEEGIWKNDKFLYSQKKISPNLNQELFLMLCMAN